MAVAWRRGVTEQVGTNQMAETPKTKEFSNCKTAFLNHLEGAFIKAVIDVQPFQTTVPTIITNNTFFP